MLVIAAFILMSLPAVSVRVLSPDGDVLPERFIESLIIISPPAVVGDVLHVTLAQEILAPVVLSVTFEVNKAV